MALPDQRCVRQCTRRSSEELKEKHGYWSKKLLKLLQSTLYITRVLHRQCLTTKVMNEFWKCGFVIKIKCTWGTRAFFSLPILTKNKVSLSTDTCWKNDASLSTETYKKTTNNVSPSTETYKKTMNNVSLSTTSNEREKTMRLFLLILTRTKTMHLVLQRSHAYVRPILTRNSVATHTCNQQMYKKVDPPVHVSWVFWY